MNTRRRQRKTAIAGAPAAAWMGDNARARYAFCRRHLPMLRRRTHQQLPANRTSLAQRPPTVEDTVAATHILLAISGVVQIALVDDNLRPISLEFLSNQHGKRCTCTLPDVGPRRPDMHDPVRIDLKERIWRKPPAFFSARLGARWSAQRDQQATGAARRRK